MTWGFSKRTLKFRPSSEANDDIGLSVPEVSITDLTPFAARCDIVTPGEKHQKLRVGPAPCPAPKPFPATPPRPELWPPRDWDSSAPIRSRKLPTCPSRRARNASSSASASSLIRYPDALLLDRCPTAAASPASSEAASVAMDLIISSVCSVIFSDASSSKSPSPGSTSSSPALPSTRAATRSSNASSSARSCLYSAAGRGGWPRASAPGSAPLGASEVPTSPPPYPSSTSFPRAFHRNPAASRSPSPPARSSAMHAASNASCASLIACARCDAGRSNPAASEHTLSML
mmetsp:Transcript_518/g.1944  ORF Transcript_518/g.1944 Transcript_518/m.1944 type:complete len:289 (-) Transcript_518:914-1780(-)